VLSAKNGYELYPAEYADSVAVDIDPEDVKHLVVLLHGIRTAAEWQEEIRDAIEGLDLIVKPMKYDYFDVLRFIMPIKLFKEQKISYVTDQLRALRQFYPNAEISIIAHSFGTFIVSEIIKRQLFGSFRRIVFCGSVVKVVFSWSRYLLDTRSLINDCGEFDYWPIVAEVITFGYGASGYVGFNDVAVENRFHLRLRHSDFLNAHYARRYWRSFIVDGVVLRPKTRRWKIPFCIQLVRRCGIKYLFWLGLLLLVHLVCLTLFNLF
jgi:hypothetical protein